MLRIRPVPHVGMPQGLYELLGSRYLKSLQGDKGRVVLGKTKGMGMGGLELTFEGGLMEF